MMCVVITSKVSDRITGVLQGLLWEVQEGVFVGRMSRKMLNALWQATHEELQGEGWMVYVIEDSTQEAGFFIRTSGKPSREIREKEGLPCIGLHPRPRASI